METSVPTKKFLKEINAGITSLLLLSIVNRAETPLYGYQIAKQIDFDSEKGISMNQSALYPVLRSLERNELLNSRVEPSVSGPPRKYYRITDYGREILTEWESIWDHVKNNVDAVLKGEKYD